MTTEIVPTVEQLLSADGYEGRRITISEYDRKWGDGAYVPQRLINGRWEAYKTYGTLRYSANPHSMKSRVSNTTAYKTKRGAYNFLLKKMEFGQ